MAARGTAVTLFACSLFFGQFSEVLLMTQSVDLACLPCAYTMAAVRTSLLAVKVPLGLAALSS